MISKEKMKIVIENYFKDTCDINTSIKEAFIKGFEIGVEKGQSLKSERQIGCWTYDMKDEYWGDWYICSVCGHSSIKNNYCPNCGAKMENI